VRPGASIRPNRSTAAVYDEGYRTYRALYQALKPIFHMRDR